MLQGSNYIAAFWEGGGVLHASAVTDTKVYSTA